MSKTCCIAQAAEHIICTCCVCCFAFHRSPSFAHQQSTGSSPMSDGRCASAAAGSPGDMSPLHPRRLSSPGNGLDDAAAGQVRGVALTTLYSAAKMGETSVATF